MEEISMMKAVDPPQTSRQWKKRIIEALPRIQTHLVYQSQKLKIEITWNKWKIILATR